MEVAVSLLDSPTLFSSHSRVLRQRRAARFSEFPHTMAPHACLLARPPCLSAAAAPRPPAARCSRPAIRTPAPVPRRARARPAHRPAAFNPHPYHGSSGNRSDGEDEEPGREASTSGSEADAGGDGASSSPASSTSARSSHAAKRALSGVAGWDGRPIGAEYGEVRETRERGGVLARIGAELSSGPTPDLLLSPPSFPPSVSFNRASPTSARRARSRPWTWTP